MMIWSEQSRMTWREDLGRVSSFQREKVGVITFAKSNFVPFIHSVFRGNRVADDQQLIGRPCNRWLPVTPFPRLKNAVDNGLTEQYGVSSPHAFNPWRHMTSFKEWHLLTTKVTLYCMWRPVGKDLSQGINLYRWRQLSPSAKFYVISVANVMASVIRKMAKVVFNGTSYCPEKGV